MLPALQAIKDVLPDAAISWVVGAQVATLVQGHPLVSRTYVVSETRLYSPRRLARLAEAMRLGREISETFDTVMIAHRSDLYSLAFRAITRAPVVQLTRTPDTLLQSALRRGVRVAPMTVHETGALRSLVTEGLRLFVDRDSVALKWRWDFSYIDASGIDVPPDAIAVHLGGGSNAKTEFGLKRWPHSGDLVNDILRRTGWSVVLLGSALEAEDAARLVSQLSPSNGSRIVNLVGRTTLRELVDVIRRCKALVGPDSGPLHIADALDVPSVGLYGPTSPVSWGLVSAHSRMLFEDVPCRPCYNDAGIFPACPYDQRCMKGLGSEKVFRELVGAVRQASGGAQAGGAQAGAAT